MQSFLTLFGRFKSMLGRRYPFDPPLTLAGAKQAKSVAKDAALTLKEDIKRTKTDAVKHGVSDTKEPLTSMDQLISSSRKR